MIFQSAQATPKPHSTNKSPSCIPPSQQPTHPTHLSPYPIPSNPLPRTPKKNPITPPSHASPFPLLRLLLPRLHRPRLGRFLPITPYHNHSQKAADDGRTEEDEDDGDADGPDARGEEVVEGVAGVDEGLGGEGGWVSFVGKGVYGGLGERGGYGWGKGKVEGEGEEGGGDTMRRVHVV